MARYTPLLLYVAACVRAAFVPFFPRGTSAGGQPNGRQPGQLGATGGLSEDEVRSLLAGRCALVMAQRDTDLALDVTEGLVQLGARVLLTCERPDECSRRVGFVNRRAAERRAAASAQALTAAGGGGRRRRRKRLEPELVEAGCVTAQLDLCDSSAIWDFADAFSAGGWPLHVVVSCSDERCAAGGGRAAEERCAAANHLGVQTLPAAPARPAPARRGPFAPPDVYVTAPPPPALRPVPAHVAPLRLARRDDAP